MKQILEKVSKRTKMLILNSPCNPTGAVISKEQLVKIAKLCVEKKIFVVSDEVYESFVYEHKRNTSIASLGSEIYNLTLTVNAVSKTYAMTGWRIGYCAGPEEIIKAIDNLQGHMTSGPSSISQKAAIEALKGDQSSVRKFRIEFRKRRDYVLLRLNNMRGIKCSVPDGAFYVFVDISGTGLDSRTFSSKLLEKAKVAVVPGIAFGDDRHIRISYATSMDKIKSGMDRIEEFCRRICSREY